jgi:hypothetical protein
MTPGIYIIKLFTAVRITIAKTYKWTLAINGLLILASQTLAIMTSLLKHILISLLLTELLFLLCYQKLFSNKLGFILDSSLFFRIVS